eukprot:TRINITY_DN12204_c0_g1_i1.p1 TRINITY_DN12204_c0_g1~~TRINITY_DN12204_c0_g1_i1.p1  ORF type:complete len:457 (+),score=140.61 TRINITY_DN12204_c0_g1_i1:23-1393(+)
MMKQVAKTALILLICASCIFSSSTADEQPDCESPAITGPCEAAIQAWFYNTKTKSCEEFQYGGCEGTGNNYESEEACKKSCTLACDMVYCDDPCKGQETNCNGYEGTIICNPDYCGCNAYFYDDFTGEKINPETCKPYKDDDVICPAVYCEDPCKESTCKLYEDNNKKYTCEPDECGCNPVFKDVNSNVIENCDGDDTTCYNIRDPCTGLKCEDPAIAEKVTCSGNPKNCEPQWTDEDGNDYTKQCSGDDEDDVCTACRHQKCARYPLAKCVPNDQCEDYDFILDETVVDDCDADDCEEVQCLIDPCETAECKASQDAVCVADYCGGCNAYFYLVVKNADGEETISNRAIDCDSEQLVETKFTVSYNGDLDADELRDLIADITGLDENSIGLSEVVSDDDDADEKTYQVVAVDEDADIVKDAISEYEGDLNLMSDDEIDSSCTLVLSALFMLTSLM